MARDEADLCVLYSLDKIFIARFILLPNFPMRRLPDLGTESASPGFWNVKKDDRDVARMIGQVVSFRFKIECLCQAEIYQRRLQDTTKARAS
jgi:hypothetical protein